MPRQRKGTRPMRTLILLLMLSLAMSACVSKKTIVLAPSEYTSPAPTSPAAPVAPQLPTMAEAYAIWESGDMGLAAQYYEKIATADITSTEDKALAWQYYAMAMSSMGQAHNALQGLQECLALDPQADQSAVWQETWYAAASQLPAQEAMDLARVIYPDQSRPWPLRAQAGLLFGVRQIVSIVNPDAAQLANPVHLLNDIYTSANAAWRASLELQLYKELDQYPTLPLSVLRGMVNTGNIGQYPYNVIQLQKVGVLLSSPSTVATATGAIVQLQQHASFENTELYNTVLGSIAAQSTCLAFALPLSGPYAPIGLKIARGASAAQWELGNKGQNIDLHLINTEAPTWLDQIVALPSQCTTVGGPLRATSFAEAKARGIDNRAFFTFMSQLETTAPQTTTSQATVPQDTAYTDAPDEPVTQAPIPDEGTIAWRFFTSTQDQMTALLDFSYGLGISKYCILAPDEPYGHHMSALFSQKVQERGGTVSQASYPPSTITAWNGIAGKLLGRKTINKMPVPTADFQALFLPDSWRNMEILVPNIFYHGEDRQVLLGTAIWSQGLSTGGNVTNNFALSTFPNAWNPYAQNQAMQSLASYLSQIGQEEADLWVGLGYDFVRFASLLSLPQNWTAHDVNAQLPSLAASFDWSMAPISWTADGIASQQLFLFSPTASGFTPLNEEAFAKRLERTRTRHAARVATAKKDAAKK